MSATPTTPPTFPATLATGRPSATVQPATGAMGAARLGNCEYCGRRLVPSSDWRNPIQWLWERGKYAHGWCYRAAGEGRAA